MDDGSYSAANISNEETLRANVLVPWLHRHGFDPGSLLFEQTFSIRLGRTCYVHDAGEALRKFRSEGSGRLDVLCKLDGRNHIVFELKHPDHPIHEDDVSQGISYARLLEQMAPLVVATNGRETVVVDTITRQRVDPGQMRNSNGLSISLSSADYFEALSMFVSLTPENARRAARVLLDVALEPYTFAPPGERPCYDREIAIHSRVVKDVIRALLEANNQAVVLSGDSGAGKSCAACCAAEDLWNAGTPVFLLKALDAQHGIWEAISDSLSWHFPPDAGHVQAVISKLARCLGSNSIVVVIDGLDEIEPSTARSVVEKALNATIPVKFVLTCKSSAVPSLMRHGTLPTRLAVRALRSGDSESISVRLDDGEFWELVSRLRRSTGYDGVLGQTFVDLARENLYLLTLGMRTAVAAGVREVSIEHISTTLAAYLDHVFEQMEREQHGARALVSRIARRMFDDDQLEVAADDVVGGDSIILERLRAAGLLRARTSRHRMFVSFKYDVLASHAMAFLGRRLAECPEHELRGLIESLPSTGPRVAALAYYYNTATLENRRAFDRGAFEWCVSYLRHLREAMATDLPNGALTVDARSAAELGVVGTFDREGSLIAWGPARIDSSWLGHVLLRPSRGLNSKANRELFRKGAHSLGYTMGRLQSPEAAASSTISDFAAEQVRKGKLQEASYLPLVQEAVQILCLERKIVSPDVARDAEFPISRVREGLRRRLMERAVYFSVVHEQIRCQQNGLSLDNESYATASIEERARQLIEQGVDPKSVAWDCYHEEPELRLAEYLNILESTGVSHVALLPWVSLAYSSRNVWYRPSPHSWFSEAQIAAICSFHDHFRRCCGAVLAANFPQYERPRVSPVRLLAVLDYRPLVPLEKLPQLFLWDGLDTVILDGDFVGSSSHGASVMMLREPLDFDPAFTDSDIVVATSLGDFRVDCWQRSSDFGFRSARYPTLGRDASTGRDVRHDAAALRNGLYDLLESLGPERLLGRSLQSQTPGWRRGRRPTTSGST